MMVYGLMENIVMMAIECQEMGAHNLLLIKDSSVIIYCYNHQFAINVQLIVKIAIKKRK